MTITEPIHAAHLTARRIDLVDSSGRVRMGLEAYDNTGPQSGGALLTIYDRHGRRVLSMGVNDGWIDGEDWAPTQIHFDRIAADDSTIIDPDLDVKVTEPWAALT